MRTSLFAILLLIATSTAYPQIKKGRDASMVRKEQADTKKQMGQTQRQLDINRRHTATKLNELNALNAQIITSNNTIRELSTAIAEISSKEKVLIDSISKIEAYTGKLKKEYAKGLRDSRKRRQCQSEMSFIFSAKSFNHAMRRNNYVKQLNGRIDSKATSLKNLQDELSRKQAALSHLKSEKMAMLENLSQENNRLQEHMAQVQIIVADLQKEGATLAFTLQEQQNRISSLDGELDRLIAQEKRAAEEKRLAEERRHKSEAARKAEEKRKSEMLAQQKPQIDVKPAKTKKEKAKAAPTNNSPKSDRLMASNTPSKKASPTPPAKSKSSLLAGSFASNKGNLLFPVTGKYKIVGMFGVHQHTNLPYVQTDNSGIDIEVSPGSNALAVYDGEVSTIFFHDGYQNVVMVRHGEYLTVYTNIDRLSVKKGDKVKAGQQLGHIFTDNYDNNRTVLHFEVRKETKKLNPLDWVCR